MYRPGDIDDIQVACHGVLSPKTIRNLINTHSSMSFMQSILNYLVTTRQSTLTKNIHTVYVAYEYFDTSSTKKNTTIGQSISDENHKTIFFKALTPKGVNSQHFEDPDAVAKLRDIKKNK